MSLPIGSIPSTIGSLTALTYIDLDTNKLTGINFRLFLIYIMELYCIEYNRLITFFDGIINKGTNYVFAKQFFNRLFKSSFDVGKFNVMFIHRSNPKFLLSIGSSNNTLCHPRCHKCRNYLFSCVFNYCYYSFFTSRSMPY